MSLSCRARCAVLRAGKWLSIFFDMHWDLYRSTMSKIPPDLGSCLKVSLARLNLSKSDIYENPGKVKARQLSSLHTSLAYKEEHQTPSAPVLCSVSELLCGKPMAVALADTLLPWSQICAFPSCTNMRTVYNDGKASGLWACSLIEDVPAWQQILPASKTRKAGMYTLWIADILP